MKRVVALSLVAGTVLMASGYKVPEQSLNSVALSGAYVSHANTADAAYYNPANMAFMDGDRQVELNMLSIFLPQVKFTGQSVNPLLSAHNAESEEEYFLVPQIHVVGPEMGNLRVGFSITAPGGLSKRWESTPESYVAKEFSLKILEFNPVVSYRVSEMVGLAAGVRLLYSDGTVITEPTAVPDPTNPATYPMDMKGDSYDWGYNVALSYKPLPEFGLAVTYRSNVDLTISGGQAFDPSLTIVPVAIASLPGDTELPLPAILSVASDYTFNESTTVEFAYERVFWSTYEELVININGEPSYTAEKNWNDSNTYRLGVIQKISDTLTAMLGFAYDETPIPDETVSFELPDSDAYIGSIGLRYQVNDALELGIAYLQTYKQDRTVSQTPAAGYVDGEFKEGGAHLLSLGVGYRY